MTENEFLEKARAALLDGLLCFEGARYNDETIQAMMQRMAEVWPPRAPIRWVESVKIEGNSFGFVLTEEATELLKKADR